MTDHPDSHLEGQPAAPEQTSGSDEREPREMLAAVVVAGIATELGRLRSETQYLERDRNSVTLAKATDLRVVLTALRSGARVGEDEAHGPLTVQVLEGSVYVGREADGLPLIADEIAALDSGGPWFVEAREDSAVLLTLAWPEERSLV